MIIAIDDTYSKLEQDSTYVTSERKSHIAVIFNHNEVDYIRDQIKQCLIECSDYIGETVKEFHFVDIYNKNGVWKLLKNGDEYNLDVFESFAEIYKIYKWKVEIQTVDKHTFTEHGIRFESKSQEWNLEKKEDQSLLFLLAKLKKKYRNDKSFLKIYMDEGRKKSGNKFALEVFSDWTSGYDGEYTSSEKEPLLQLADFLAYSINRCIHLQHKSKLTDYDKWFLELVANMNINCQDLKVFSANSDSIIEDVNKFHENHRKRKGLNNLYK